MNRINVKLPWFRRTGIFYIPVSFIGWIIFACALVIAIHSFIDIDSRSHSVSDTLINFVFNLLIISAVYSLIGYLSSSNPGE